MATSRSEPRDRLCAKTPRRHARRPAPPFRRVLIANRGEIAVRIIRACHELGMEAVAVYSDADADAAARPAGRRGGPPRAAAAGRELPARSTPIIEAARATGAEAIHPGYGFLAERAAFARAVEDAGPRLRRAVVATRSRRSATSSHARRAAPRASASPVGPGDARAGAGRPARRGRGDRRRRRSGSASRCWSRRRPAAADAGCAASRGRPSCRPRWPAGRARRRPRSATASVYLEREIRPARHIEVQLLGDAHGTVVALGERDCSLQRRHQKLVEEAPAPGLTADERRRPPRPRGPASPRRPGCATRRRAEFLLRRRRPRSGSSRSTPGSRSSTASPSSWPASTSSASSSGSPPGAPLSAR